MDSIKDFQFLLPKIIIHLHSFQISCAIYNYHWDPFLPFRPCSNNALNASFLNQSDFSSLCLIAFKIWDRTSIVICEDNSYLPLKLITKDLGDHFVQTNVAAFSNCVDFYGCGVFSPEEEPEEELEELKQSLSESDASEVGD